MKKNIYAHPPDDVQIDVFFISYPKSGRTWLRFLLGKALTLQYGVDERYVPETYHLTHRLDVPTMQFVHNGMDPHKADRFKYGAMPDDQGKFKPNQVVFMIRDPRDTLVSAFYWATMKAHVYEGAIRDFIRSDEHGIKKILEFYNLWHRQRQIPRSFFLISYESLHKAPFETLTALFQYLNIAIKPVYIDKAIEFARFDNMRRLEEQGRSRFLTPDDLRDTRSYKTRQGEIGNYKTILTTEDLTFIEHAIREMGCPFLESPEILEHHDYLGFIT